MTAQMSSSLEWRMRKQQSKLGLPVDEPEQQQEKLGWPLVKPEQQHRELGWPIDKPEQEQGGLGWSVDKWVEEQGQHHTADASSSFFHVGSTANIVSNGVIRVDSSRVESHVELAGDERAAAKEDGAELERAAAVRWRAERQLMIALRAAAAGGWVGALERPRAVGNASVSGSAQQSLGQPRVAGNVGANVAGNVARNLRATALRSRKLAAAKLPSQKGFVSIDCGYMGSAGASNLGLKWLPDTAAPGGSVAVITRVPDELVGQVTVEQTLRVFDDGKPSNCYQIPLVAPGRYLVRLTFWYGNYDGKNMPPVFNVTVGTVSLGQYTPSNDQILVLEVIVTVPARTLAICLVRVSADPIINALEIRPLPADAYNGSDYSEQLLLNYWRLSCAGDSWLVGSYRYPDDPLDRVWYADMPLFGDPAPGTYTYIPAAASVAVTSSSIAIPPSMSSNAVPQFVVQKARTTKGPQGLTYRFYGLAPGKYQAYLYFTDIIPPADATSNNAPSADLLLAILINGSPLLRNAPALPSTANRQWNKNTAGQLSFAFDVVGAAEGAGGNATAKVQGAGQGNGQQQGPQGTVAETSIQLKAEEGSRVKEVGLSGLELYTVVEPKAAVPKGQVRALSCIKAQMGGAAALDGWTGDPCYPIVWPGVTCKTSRLHSSVIGLNLTHLNISGPFSACISELTTLQTLWMDHNRLQGSIPSSIGNLTQLRSIKLNNNKLSGPVPASLAALPNLQFLDLSSNNLSGPLPFNRSSNVQIGLSAPLLCSPSSSFNLVQTSPPHLPPHNIPKPSVFSSPSLLPFLPLCTFSHSISGNLNLCFPDASFGLPQPSPTLPTTTPNSRSSLPFPASVSAPLQLLPHVSGNLNLCSPDASFGLPLLFPESTLPPSLPLSSPPPCSVSGNLNLCSPDSSINLPQPSPTLPTTSPNPRSSLPFPVSVSPLFNFSCSVSGNLNLCSPDASFGLPPCNNTIPTPSSSPSDTSAQTATSPAAMSTAVLMALILGVIIGVLMVLLASWLLLRWQQRAAERGGMGGRSGAGGGGGGGGVGGDGLGQQPPVVVYVHGDTGAVTVQAAGTNSTIALPSLNSAGATLYTQSNQVLLSPKATAGLSPAAVTAAAAAKTAAIEGTEPPAFKASVLPAVPASQEETPLLAPAPDKPAAAPAAAAAAESATAEAAVPAAPTEGMAVPGAGNAVGPAAFAAGAAALATGAAALATGNSPARGKAASTPGGFGPVYRGVLPDGRMVAVKRRDDDSLQGDREFVNEVDLLSRACHPNLVELVGYCREARQHLLVYEFMPNGTVREHLYDQMGQPLGRLRWLTRIQIALGAARAIQYLHTCLQPPIIHRDIKTSNILLDGRLNARVADFGLSRVGPQDNRSHVSTVVKGTAGYLDPEYFTIQQLTDRSDVFSFGVVLLELISGQQPIDLNRPQQHWSIIDWVSGFDWVSSVVWSRNHLQQGNIRAVADPTLLPHEWDEEAMWRVAEVGMVCVEPKSLNCPPSLPFPPSISLSRLVSCSHPYSFSPPYPRRATTCSRATFGQ
ncbi:unnamed protein product [Closterium sp. NIES-65]|nr:unnamed protein product [Closterium sp. NIES-65]